jgi:DNA-binding response OmpR family regulator
MDKHILIIEDDPDIGELVRINLHDAGFRTQTSTEGPAGLQAGLDGNFDLVVLDIMLPGMDGLEVCRRLRQARPDIPIFILTSKSEEFDKVLGLELGADDYLTKPFSVREFVARVRALLRRSGPATEEVTPATTKLIRGPLEIDPDKRRVRLSGSTVELTAKEFDLLFLFASHPGRVYSREQLLENVWGYQYRGYEHTVNTHINRLRAKIEPNPAKPSFILTVWGVGYRFSEPAEDDENDEEDEEDET